MARNSPRASRLTGIQQTAPLADPSRKPIVYRLGLAAALVLAALASSRWMAR